MMIRPSDLHPRFYRLHSDMPASWGNFLRDPAGHWWLDCGRFVFTTTPPSRYEEDGAIRKFVRRRGF